MDNTKAKAPLMYGIVGPDGTAGSVDTLQRYELVETSSGTGYMVRWDKSMEEDADGEWVKHSDVNAWAAQHVANAIKDQKERAEKAEARAAHLEHFFKHHSVQVPPQYTAMHTMEDSSANKK